MFIDAAIRDRIDAREPEMGLSETPPSREERSVGFRGYCRTMKRMSLTDKWSRPRRGRAAWGKKPRNDDRPAAPIRSLGRPRRVDGLPESWIFFDEIEWHDEETLHEWRELGLEERFVERMRAGVRLVTRKAKSETRCRNWKEKHPHQWRQAGRRKKRHGFSWNEWL